MPAYGVYATRVEVDGKIYGGVTNVGVKPTVTGENQMGIETHILDFDQDVYEKDARVVFLSHIRDEKKFDSVEELFAQMERDKKTALSYFNH